MHLIYFILRYSNNPTKLNKLIHQIINNRSHQITTKSKYNIYLNKNQVGHIELDYKIKYNWLIELNRINRFDKWELLKYTNKKTTELYLSYNQIKEIPKEISQLINLQKLSLSNNQIKEIPKEISQLINLKEL